MLLCLSTYAAASTKYASASSCVARLPTCRLLQLRHQSLYARAMAMAMAMGSSLPPTWTVHPDRNGINRILQKTISSSSSSATTTITTTTNTSSNRISNHSSSSLFATTMLRL